MHDPWHCGHCGGAIYGQINPDVVRRHAHHQAHLSRIASKKLSKHSDTGTQIHEDIRTEHGVRTRQLVVYAPEGAHEEGHKSYKEEGIACLLAAPRRETAAASDVRTHNGDPSQSRKRTVVSRLIALASSIVSRSVFESWKAKTISWSPFDRSSELQMREAASSGSWSWPSSMTFCT